MTTAAPRVVATGLISTVIYPFNPVVLLEKAFESSSASGRPIQYKVKRTQNTPPKCDNQEISTNPKEAALSCSTSIGRSVREIMPPLEVWPET
jgi:hypothetical protein